MFRMVFICSGLRVDGFRIIQDHCHSCWGLQNVLASRLCVDSHTHDILSCCYRSPGMSGLLSRASWDIDISNWFCIWQPQALCSWWVELHSRIMLTWPTYIIWIPWSRFSLTIVLGSKVGIFNELHLVPPEFQSQHATRGSCWGLQDWASFTWSCSS